MSTLKIIKDEADEAALLTDYTTLTQLQSSEDGTACVPEGTYLRTVVMNKFPKANYLDCLSPLDCVSYLKEGRCQLYADDELMLKYRALNDPVLEVTGEKFNTQYIVWPIKYSLATEKSRLLKKWMYASVANATLDLLDYKYFSVKLCPLGLAGENCDLNCDPKVSEERCSLVCAYDMSCIVSLVSSLCCAYDMSYVQQPSMELVIDMGSVYVNLLNGKVTIVQLR